MKKCIRLTKREKELVDRLARVNIELAENKKLIKDIKKFQRKFCR